MPRIGLSPEKFVAGEYDQSELLDSAGNENTHWNELKHILSGTVEKNLIASLNTKRVAAAAGELDDAVPEQLLGDLVRHVEYKRGTPGFNNPIRWFLSPDAMRAGDNAADKSAELNKKYMVISSKIRAILPSEGGVGYHN